MSGEDENYKDGVRSLAQFKNSSDPRFISEALSSLTISSNKGNPRAMLLLGGIYRNGCGVPIDYKRANLYFAESAKQGDADAIFNLCWAHLRGNGFEQNYEKALSYGLDAAKLGHSEAQLVLGLMFRRGHGCEKNYPEAIKWIELSSQQENGNAKAQLKDLLDSVEYKNYLKSIFSFFFFCHRFFLGERFT